MLFLCNSAGTSPSEMRRAPGVRPRRAAGAACVSQHSPRGPLPPVTPCAGGTVSARPSAISDNLRGSLVTGCSSPGPGGRLPTAQAVGLCRGLGARGLPALVPPKPASPHAPDRLPAQPSASLRGLYGLETLARAPASRPLPTSTWYPAPPTRSRDSKP